MAILPINREVNEASLWEMGIALPIANPLFDRFEKQVVLSRDINKGDDYFYVSGHNSFIKPNSRIFIGPSSDPTRNASATLISFGQYETFEVALINEVGDEDQITIRAIEDGFSSVFENYFVAGDPVTFRSVAESWEYIREDQFAGINSVADPRQDQVFKFSREDSLDDMSGFSQSIATNNPIALPVDMGISQKISGEKGAVLGLLQGKPLFISCWVRVQDAYKWVDGVYDTGIVKPYIICSFYSNNDALKVHAIPSYTYIFTTSQIPGRYVNTLLQDRVMVPANAQSMRIGAYANFSRNPDAQDLKIHIDNVIVEHAAGTTQSNNARYFHEINPAVNLSVANSRSRETERLPSNVLQHLKIGDPQLRLKIDAEWQNRPEFFVQDMRAFERWNGMGYPIVLRTKMPGQNPVVMLCNMRVRSDSVVSASNTRSNVRVEFEEVAS